MISATHSDPKWLQSLLRQAIDEHWCTRINCTTCGSDQLRAALDPCLRTSADAKLIIDGLRECEPPSTDVYPFEEAMRWVLYAVWARFGESFDSDLNGTYAYQVLTRMQKHHADRMNARRIHEERQDVKRRDWKE